MADSHTVELDIDGELETLAQLSREAAAADAEQERQTENIGHDPDQWQTAAAWLASLIDTKVCPNWQLGNDDRDELTKKTALVLDHYFPGGVQGIDNWHPTLQLLFTVGGVAMIRGFDFERFAFKPLHPRTENEHGPSDESQRLERVSDGDDPEREVGAGFSIGGG